MFEVKALAVRAVDVMRTGYARAGVGLTTALGAVSVSAEEPADAVDTTAAVNALDNGVTSIIEVGGVLLLLAATGAVIGWVIARIVS